MSRIANVFRHLKKLFQSQEGPASSQVSYGLGPTSSRERDHNLFNEGDRALIKHGHLYKLTPPLSAGSKTVLKSGSFRHDEILGQRLGALKIRTSRNTVIELDNPTLDDYISKSPRLVQPIYSRYANTIVDLLDIHVRPFSSSSPRVEILDAGTGHGSLALHLARAIAAANLPPPELPFPELRLKSTHAGAVTPHGYEEAKVQRSWHDYHESRKAIVHTVERHLDNSIHAEKMIRGLRQGLYWHHINFYACRVGDWVIKQAHRGPFLSYITLDLPDVHREIASVSEALMPDGKVCVFAPSITQIAECLKIIDEKKAALYLDKVIELGEGISTGRVWDLRYFTPRAREKSQAKPIDPTLEVAEVDEDPAFSNEDQETTSSDDHSTGKVLVCRPKVGDRVVGGGFIGLFRKTPPDDPIVSPEISRLLKASEELGRSKSNTVRQSA